MTEAFAEEPFESEVATAGEERPSWLPSNFKTPEALVESYSQARGRVSQLSEKLQETEETLNVILESQEQELAAAPAQRQPAWGTNDDYLTLLGKLASTAAQSAVRNLPPIGDFDPAAQAHAVQVERLVQSDPELRGIDVKSLVGDRVNALPDEAFSTPSATVAAMKSLVREAQRDQLHSIVGTQHQIAAEGARLMKLAAQSAQGNGPRPEPTSGESDQAFAQSLLDVSRSGYAASRKW